MKRIFTTLLVAFATTALMAQMKIWYNGSVVYQRDYTKIDSITFNLQNNPIVPSNVEDGVYLLGEATVATDFSNENATRCLMGKGMNEVYKQYRNGMYEKYVALERGKYFEIVTVEYGRVSHHYGAQLAQAEIETDAAPTTGFKGIIQEYATMQVAQSGLYHVIVDFNEDNSLDNAQIILLPCNWGVLGAMNGWGGNITPSSVTTFDKETITYTWADILVKHDGEFKFRHGNCWKVVTDNNNLIKAEVCVGASGVSDGAEYCDSTTALFHGGKNFKIDAGYHDITLTWNLTGGAMGNSFVGQDTKTGDYVFDGSTLVLSLIGSAIENDYNWTTDADLTYEGIVDGYYTYSVTNYTLYAGEFKVRLNHDWSESWGWYDMDIWGDSNNIYNPYDGNFGASSTQTYQKISFQFTVDNNYMQNKRLVFVP